ncbi:MAG: LysR family transcriptional regulator [Sporomusaceae bacterium]|nr:LysR family transcriptional regulator [Sporomusaceae bacterium]
MEFRQLQIFCTAAQTLNFTKAGEKLGYAQSNITGQIHQLETELQVKLFERLGRNIQLTSEGKAFLQNAQTILALCAKAKAEFSPQVYRGSLTIGAAETLCVYRLPAILQEYRSKYPQVELRVRTEPCEKMPPLLKSNDIDIALVLTDKITIPNIAANLLQQESMILVASPQHHLAAKQSITPADFTTECLILTMAGCGYRPLILAMLREQQVKPSSLMELSSMGAIKECTSCGLGVAFLPEVSVKQEIADKKLVALPWNGPAFNVNTILLYHQEKWLTPALRAFLALCQSCAK